MGKTEARRKMAGVKKTEETEKTVNTVAAAETVEAAGKVISIHDHPGEEPRLPTVKTV